MQRGATLFEIALFLGITGVIAAGAVALGSGWFSSVRDISQGATVAAQRDSLLGATRSLYRVRVCRGPGGMSGHPVEGALEMEDLRAYLPGRRLVRETQLPADRWHIVVTRQQRPVPEVHLRWEPQLGDSLAAIARRSGAVCDADGIGTTVDHCPDFSHGTERLLWMALVAAPTDQRLRRRRMLEWFEFNAIDCDTDGPDSDGDGVLDGDGRLDEPCDVDVDGLFGPYDADGDGLDDSLLFDADADGFLDFDVAGGADGSGDLAVDIHDWHALGC